MWEGVGNTKEQGLSPALTLPEGISDAVGELALAQLDIDRGLRGRD